MSEPPARNTHFRPIVSYWRWFDRISASAVIVLALTTLVTAFIGVFSSSASLSSGNSLTRSIYEAGQALLLNMEPHHGTFNAWIGVARIAALLLVTLIAIKAIGALLKSSFTRLRLWWWGRGSVLVFGLGDLGKQIAREKLRAGHFVIAHEIGGPDSWTQQLEDEGAVVVQGDVTDAASITEFIDHDPRAVYLVNGDDHTNITTLNHILRIRQTRGDRSAVKSSTPLPPLECYVHIGDPAMENVMNRALATYMASPDRQELAMRIQTFNILHETARQLIIEKLTPIRPRIPRPARADDSSHGPSEPGEVAPHEVALYIVLGFGKSARAVVKELAEFAHFENLQRSRILVLTPHAEQACDRFLHEWGRLSPRWVHAHLDDIRFDPACDAWNCRTHRPAEPYQVDEASAIEYAANVHFCEMPLKELSSPEIASLVEFAESPGVCPAILVCYDDVHRNFVVAHKLNDTLQEHHGINVAIAGDAVDFSRRSRTQEFHLPIFLRMPNSDPFTSILRNTDARYPLIPFGDVREGMARVHDTAVGQIAQDIAWSYERRATDGPAEPTEAFRLHWQSKQYWDRHSNRMAAEHAWVKLQIVDVQVRKNEGRAAAAPQEPPEVPLMSPEQKKLLARIEHHRWVAERLLQGWSYGERCDQPPRRPSLCSLDTLNPAELEKDGQQIDEVLRSLVRQGYEVVASLGAEPKAVG